jgi:ubiquinone/menaquinone biosynthesis C-methylase UbiE
VARFRCVARAAELARPAETSQTSVLDAPSLLSSLSSLTSSLSSLTPLRAQYAAAQGLRFSYFIAQSVLNARLVQKSNVDIAAVASTLAQALLSPARPETLTTRDLLGRELTPDESQRASLFWLENIRAILALLRDDLAKIDAGEYKMPYDLQPLSALRGGAGAAQWTPSNVFSMATKYLADQERVAARRTAPAGATEMLERLTPAERAMYPEYYLRNFHFQTDGWMSAESAALYDYQVETLFLGSADAMRRQVLPDIRAWLLSRGSTDGDGLTMLDAATGTGRLLSFVKDNHPALDCTAVDLSPFYLAEAEKTLQPWLGDGSRLRFLQANVEGPISGLADASFDSVLCCYLFHELPPEARQAAAKEFGRLLKPGGRLFFVDSAQRGDGGRNAMPGSNDRALEGFPRYSHEPFYESYVQTDLAGLFRECGGLVEVGQPRVGWLTKVLVLEKQAAEEVAAVAAVAEEPAAMA